jgi:transposase-like protein
MEVILLIKEDIHLKKLEAYIENILKKDIYENKQVECCPVCGSSEYIKYGSYKGIQRYKCKECLRTFSKATNSLWSYSKHNPSKWIEFLELMMEKKSLRFCATKLGINLATAFYWRHKILYGLTLDTLPKKLSGDIYIGKTLIKENFKGCRNIETDLRHNIWVVGAKGLDDSMIIKPISKGFWNLKKFNEKIYSNIEEKSYIIPYGDRYISLVAKSHNKNLIKEIKDENKMKFLRMNLSIWLKTFCGISTKYLEEYLSLFILFNLDKVIDYMDLISCLSLGYRFIRTKEIGNINCLVV